MGEGFARIFVVIQGKIFRNALCIAENFNAVWRQKDRKDKPILKPTDYQRYSLPIDM